MSPPPPKGRAGLTSRAGGLLTWTFPPFRSQARLKGTQGENAAGAEDFNSCVITITPTTNTDPTAAGPE